MQYKVAALQTAGYKIACEEREKIKIHARWVVNLTADGKYKITEYKSATDESVFLCALQIFRWRQNNS